MTDATRNLLEQHFDTAFAAPNGIAKLRELILTLAMQGRLVAQDPADPPASELLKEIEAEKQRLVKAGKIKPPKPLPPIKPEEVPYELPPGWEWVRLGEIGIINPRNDAEDSAKAGFIPMPMIPEGYSEKHQFEERQWSEIKKGYTHVANGDVAMAKITPCFENAKSCVFSGLPNGIGAGTTELLVFRNSFNSVVPRFLLYYLKNPQYISKALPSMTGSAGQKRVPTPYFTDQLFPLPPLPEQHRLVARIDELMARCDQLEKLRKEREEKRLAVHAAAIRQLLDAPDGSAWDFIQQHFGELYVVKENVAELRKAILQLAVMGRLVEQDPADPPASELLKEIEAEKQRLVKAGKIKPPKPLPPIKPEEVPYELPSGWEWVRLGEVCSYIQRGKGPSYVEVSTHRVISQKCVRWYGLDLEPARYIDPSSLKKYEDVRFLKVGDLLWNSTGTGTIGRACLIPEQLKDVEIVADSHVTVIRLVRVSPQFLWRWIQSPIVQNAIASSASGTTNQIELNTSTVTDQLMPLPPLSEQHRIVARIDQLMALCDRLDEQINAATGKRTKLLSAVMAQV